MGEKERHLSEQELGRIRDALQEVYDPEIGISVVDLGLVRKIEEVEGQVHVTMILTTPFCPLAGRILDAARAAVEKATGHPVQIELGSEPWDPSMMAQDARQQVWHD